VCSSDLFRTSPRGTSAPPAGLVAPALPKALGAHLGPVFGTVLRLDRAATHLAVQSCSDFTCVTRVFDLTRPDAAPAIVQGEQQGELIGFAGADLVTWAACTGRPCPVMAWNVATGRARGLVGSASSAALTGDGRRLVALLGDGSGTRPVEVDPASGRLTGLKGIPADRYPLAGESIPSVGLEVADDEVAMASLTENPVALRPDAAAVEALP